MGFEVGGRYLVSAASIFREGTPRPTTAAWRLRGSDAEFVQGMYRDARLWAGFAEADTLVEALAIVAPMAPPPTDTARTLAVSNSAPHDASNGLAVWLALAAVVTLVLSARRRTGSR